MMNRPHGRMILASVEKDPLVWPTITVDGVTRPKEYTELTLAETIQADCDIKAINIILQGLPTEIYALVSQHRVAKDIWEKIRLLMQGTSLTKQERECKLYDEFDKFTYKKGESLHEYYLRFTLLLNDMKSRSLRIRRILKDGGEVFRYSDTERLSRSDEVLKFKTFKKDSKLKLFKSTNQERYEQVGPEVTSSQDDNDYKMAKQDYTWLMISSALSFDQLFELNELKAQSQKKDTVIKKLKEKINALSGKTIKDKIKQELEEIETINIELDHRVTKLIAENKHLKQTYKQLYDSIKPARIRLKEQSFKNDLRKLKGKALVVYDVTKHPSDPEMLKIDVEPITPKLLNKQTAHSAYIKHTQEEATIHRDLVEHVKSKYLLDQSLESACRYAKLVQELLTNISKTCPSINNADGKSMAVTPKNKDKSVRFTEPVIFS
ncbi:hypothetical protein Tco_1506323 [Tanacetum coccineum]